MLGHGTFYNGSIKKITAAFGTIFADFFITRTAADNTTQTIKVPLTYASKDKAFIRQKVDPTLNYNMGRVFPAMAFQLMGIEYDSSRMISQTQYVAQMTSGTGATGSLMYTPVPYNIQFELYIGATNIEDGLQCLEQILPFFSPAYIITTKDWPTLNIIKDVPIVLNNVGFTDNTPDSDFETDRILEWTLTFTAKAYLYGPTQAAKPIKTVNDFIFSFTPSIQQAQVQVAVVPGTAGPTDAHTISTTKVENNS